MMRERLAGKPNSGLCGLTATVVITSLKGGGLQGPRLVFSLATATVFGEKTWGRGMDVTRKVGFYE